MGVIGAAQSGPEAEALYEAFQWPYFYSNYITCYGLHLLAYNEET